MKKKISFVLCLILILSNLFIVPVKADTPFDAYKRGIANLKEALEVDPNRTLTWTTDSMFTVLTGLGFMVNPTNWDLKAELLKQYAKDHGLFGLSNDDNTDQAFANKVNSSFLNNCNITDSQIVFGDYGSDLIELANYFASISGYYYAYTFDSYNNLAWFNNLNQYNGYIENMQSINIAFAGGSAYRVGVYPAVSVDYAFVGAMNTSATRPTIVSNVNLVNINSGSNIDNWSGFQINNNGENVGYTPGTNYSFKVSLKPNDIWGSDNGNHLLTIGSQKIKVYYTTSDMLQDSLGQAAYYTTDSFNNNSGVINYGNYNPVSYGDVNSYVTNYYDDNDKYPSTNEINIYINNYIPSSPSDPDNPSGGGDSGSGSGSASSTSTANNEGINININNNHNINVGIPSLSGNSVSSNGSGSSGGFFGWISDIGGVIGDFIKNVGQLIADVIKGLTETITTVLADIPNIISALVEFVYGGLPDELKAIVTLGITTVIFVGVIKMMRK